MTNLRSVTLAAVALASGLVLPSCSGELAREARAEPSGRPRIPVRVQEISATTRATGLTYLATVTAERDVLVSAPSGGRLDAVTVDVGDQVERGQVLAKVRDEDAALATAAAAAAVEQAVARLGGASSPKAAPEVALARAQLDAAEDQRARVETLAEKGSASAQDLVRARSQEAAARAQLDLATASATSAFAETQRARTAASRERVSLRETSLRAPFSGVVAERLVRAAEAVAPGGPVLRVVDPASVRIEIDVPQHEQAAVAVGSAVWVEDESTAKRARVLRVGPVLGAARTRKVVAAFEGKDAPALPGARVRVRVETGEPRRLAVVPRSAVRSLGGVTRVFVVKDDRATERLLDVTATHDGDLLVGEAVSPGELVVLEPPRELRDGDEVSR